MLTALQALADRGLNVFAMYDTGSADTGLGTADFGWGTAAFHKMGRQKVRPGLAAHHWLPAERRPFCRVNVGSRLSPPPVLPAPQMALLCIVQLPS